MIRPDLKQLTGKMGRPHWLTQTGLKKAVYGDRSRARTASKALLICPQCSREWWHLEVEGLDPVPQACPQCGVEARLGSMVEHTFIPVGCVIIYEEETCPA